MEKVTRLSDVLEYLNTNPILKETLALKGGTAINLTIFNLPRLSVDIDLDYLINNSREEMLEQRELIYGTIDRYMLSQGYSKNAKTKNPHSLDSWVITLEQVGIETISRLKSIIRFEHTYYLQKKGRSLPSISQMSIR